MTEFENETKLNFDNCTDPFDFIDLLFERTDEDGVLYVPSPNETHDGDYRCRVDWNFGKYESLKNKFKKHLNCIHQIAPVSSELEKSVDRAKEILQSEELFNFWHTYLRPFETKGFDLEKIGDICDRRETLEIVQESAKNLADGKELSDSDRYFLTEYMDLKITKEEKAYYKKYVETIYNEAEKRIGKNICAYFLVLHSKRLSRLIALKAPPIILLNEECALAFSMLLHDYGISMEPVDTSAREYLEKLEQMSEEELDEMFRPKHCNSTKSLLPLFVYTILKTKTDSKHHLRQKDILEELQKYPYELFVERKSLGRTIKSLEEIRQYAIFSDSAGVWIDQSEPKSI